jgi:hypothetical protein
MVSGVRNVALVAFLAFALGIVRAEISLTPTYSVRELEGCKFPQLEFPSTLLLNGHPTCEVDVYFALHSQRFRMSVLFVDLGESQLRFSLISRPGDFDELHKAFRASWYSWQWEKL